MHRDCNSAGRGTARMSASRMKSGIVKNRGNVEVLEMRREIRTSATLAMAARGTAAVTKN